MSTAAKLEQAAAAPRTRPVLVATDQAEADRLAADHPGALIVVTGGPRGARGLQA
jgi:hypothetical protein